MGPPDRSERPIFSAISLALGNVPVAR